ncbi:MAG: class I SAM-dependent methyltransferase [Rhodoglobus sp.]
MNGTYERGALFYDAISGEWPVYRRGRVVGIELLGLRQGDTVLDLGCGTGLNFPLLVAAVGPTGRVIGVDRSPAMLGMADRRIASEGWSNITTVNADATKFTASDIGQESVDAVFATYSLSVIGDWSAAWERLRAVLRPGGRAGIVDMQLPTGAAAILSPLARLACAMGGSDITAHPWTVLKAEGRDVRERSVRGGHIVAAAATIP